MRALSLLSVCVVALSTTSAAAQPRPRDPIDVERFKPAVTHDAFVTVEGSDVRYPLPDDAFEAGGALNYAIHPLVVVSGDGEVVDRFVSGRLGGDVFASLTLFEGFALAVDVPWFLAQTGDEDPSIAGLGDVRLVPKYRILDDRELFGLAVVGELRVPTHLGDFSGGARNVVFAPRLVADHRFGFGLRAGANAGVLLREATQFENVEAGSEFTYGVAASYAFGGYDGIASIGAEIQGATGLESIELEELPLEGLVFGQVRAGDLTLQFGPGVGLVPGYGIPAFRAFAVARWAPTSHDRDGDGIPDAEDRCPDVPEDRDGYFDRDGCPEDDDTRDDDHDGIPNADDACPNAKETINGIEDDDGCPDEGAPKVIREPEKLLVLENIQFATASAQIRPSSYSILDQVALMMKASPEIAKVRIEGHTDSRGPRELNVRLSQARADSVRRYLIGKGIAPERLEAHGFGPDRPLVRETDDASLQKNRRVDFIIEQ